MASEECLVAGIHFPLSLDCTALSFESSFFILKPQTIFTFMQCCNSASLASATFSASWQVSARCLAFYTQSGLAISSKYTDKQTISGPVAALDCSATVCVLSQIVRWTFPSSASRHSGQSYSSVAACVCVPKWNWSAEIQPEPHSHCQGWRWLQYRLTE